MRELSNFEVNQITGAGNNNGYNFSFIVENAGVVGIVGGLIAGNPLFWAGLGATYAVARMTSSALDNYFFPETQVTHLQRTDVVLTPAS